MSAVVLWDETISGDLADDFSVPTQLHTVPGDNRVAGGLRGYDFDLDLFTLTVTEGYQLSGVSLISYSSGSLANQSFLGMQPGSRLSTFPNANFGDPIGYVLYGNWAVGQDVLPTIVRGRPFSDANPLPSGSYAVWLNETGEASRYEWSFQVTAIPEPRLLVSMMGGLGLTLFRRRRSKPCK